MKKTNLIMGILGALIFASCASPAGSSTDDAIATGANNGNNGSGNSANQASYTLSFDVNYPFDASQTYDISTGKTIYASEYTENDKTFYYEPSVNGTLANKTGRSITLEQNNFGYDFMLKENDSSSRYILSYKFDHYNTAKDDTGTSYKAGETINLSGDIKLYLFYDLSKDWNEGLDFSKTQFYSMKVGETVKIANYFDYTNEVYVDTNNQDIIEAQSQGMYLAKKAGTTTLKAKIFGSENSSPTWQCTFYVTSDEGSGGSSLSTSLVGTWKCNGSNYQGTITLYANGSGHIMTTLQGRTAHDTDFSWTVNESTKSLTISGASGGGKVNGSHGLEDVRSTRFTLTGYLAFGMPSRTTWTKQ